MMWPISGSVTANPSGWLCQRAARSVNAACRLWRPYLGPRARIGSKAQLSSVFLVALEQFDRDALRPAKEADANARPNGNGLLGELDALGLDLGGDGVDVLDRQPEMIEALAGGHRRRVDAVASGDGGDEYHGAAQPDVDAPGTADDLAAENVCKPGCRRLWVGTAQMDVVPGHYRHLFCLQSADLAPAATAI